MPAWPTAVLLVAPPAIDFSIWASFWERSFSEYVLRAVFAATGASAAGGACFAPFLRTGLTSSAFAFFARGTFFFDSGTSTLAGATVV